jgi:hypothetical protein
MVSITKSSVPVGFALLGLLLAASGCRTPGDSSGPGPRAEEMSTTGTITGCPDVVEVADVQASPSAGAATVRTGAPGESLEGEYVVALAEVLYAGRLAFQDRKIRLVRQECSSNWAALDGRLEDATPARLKGEDLGEMRTKVVFTVGTRKSDLNKALVRALKEAFEARLLVAGPRDP